MVLKISFLLLLLLFPHLLSGRESEKVTLINHDIPTVTFCEMAKEPKKYFERKIRINAILTLATEAAYLSDAKNCPLSHNDQIGVSFAPAGKMEIAELNQTMRKIRSAEYGGNASVKLVGTLRNFSRRDFAWYQARFDVVQIEGLSPVIEEYRAELIAARTYRAEVRKDEYFGIALIKAIKLPYHYTQTFEWINLNDFPELKRFERRQIIFTVLAGEIKQMTNDRWNARIRCKILRIE